MFCGMRCVRRVLDLRWRRVRKAVAGRVFRHAEGIGKDGIIYIRCKTSAAKGVRLCRIRLDAYACICAKIAVVGRFSRFYFVFRLTCIIFATRKT